MSAVQVLRGKAQAAGNLKSGSQITVVQKSPQGLVVRQAAVVAAAGVVVGEASDAPQRGQPE
jgi:hypothetical protein